MISKVMSQSVEQGLTDASIRQVDRVSYEKPVLTRLYGADADGKVTQVTETTENVSGPS